MRASTIAVTRPDVALVRRPARARACWCWLAALCGLLALLCIASVAFGTRGVTWADISGAVFGTGGGDDLGRAAVEKRLPRTVLALLVGSALSVSGTTMQAITRNPLAEPGILGVSSGAALAVVIGVAFVGISDPYVYMALAVAGAAAAAILVYLIGSVGRGGASPLKLALAGAAMTAAFGSLVNAILLPRVDVMSSFRFWQIGGVGGASWDRIVVVLPFLAVGILVCASSARGMNALALGDDLAAGLGAGVARIRLVAAVGAVLLCGVATSVAGPIAFVGLVVPHVGRLLVGSDHRWLLPFAALGGAALLVAADVIGRVVARPEEVEVGIVTAVIGAPVLIWVVRQRKLREL
jgi:iron complex transport system permease protein